MASLAAKKSLTSRRGKVALALVCVIALALGAKFFLGGPEPPAKPKPSVAAQVETPKPAETLTPAPEFTPLERTSDLREISHLQTELEKQKLLVALAEQISKRMQLPGDPRYVAPAGDYQAAGTEGNAAGSAAGNAVGSAIAARPERVVSVYGLGRALTARVMTAQGTVRAVKVGDALGGATVEDVTPAGVTVRENGVLRAIKMEE